MAFLPESVRDFAAKLHVEGMARSIGMLFSANIIVAVLGFGTILMLANALGPAGLGVLALIEAYGRSVVQIVRFEPSQALIRYGTIALENGETEQLRRLIKAATLFDIGGAAVAAIVALAGLGLASAWIGFDEQQGTYAAIFAATLFLYISPTPIALLRLLSRFKLYARLLVGLAAMRFVLTLAMWQLGGGFGEFFAILIAYAILEQLVPLALAWREVHRQVEGSVLAEPLGGLFTENPGLVRFIFNSNMNVLARNSTRNLDTFILGGLVDNASIGFYQIAKRTGLAALRVARPVQFVVFPVLTRLWARGERKRLISLVVKLNIMLGLVGIAGLIVFLAFGESLVDIAFGAEFRPATTLLSIHILGASILLFGATLNPTLLSIGKDGALLSITLLATAIFFALLVPLVTRYGIVAASILNVVYNAVWSAGCMWIFLRHAGREATGSNR